MPRSRLKPRALVAAPSLLAAVRSRDVASDGRFFYAVRTTGVFCKPSCKSRAARTENLVFFASAKDAEEAGYRACKRCRPDQPLHTSVHTALVTQLCHLIESSDTNLPLDGIAKLAGMSVSKLHRVFKATTGVTPKAYGEALRHKRVQAELQTSDSVTQAMYGSGFNSSGRFYERANDMLGMTPSAFKRGGEGQRIRFAVGQCSLGSIVVASSERGVCWVALGSDPNELIEELQRRFANAELVGGDPEFEAMVSSIVGLIEDPTLPVELPLDIRGTAFQCRVWAALRHIPAGETRSYSQLATELGQPNAVRAVASACARNCLAIVIPCHRVVRTDGSLSGYRWGVERKATLLKNEKRASLDAHFQVK